jgi:hypothetical protein
MGICEDVEKKFFPEVTFTSPSEIYFALAKDVVGDMVVRSRYGANALLNTAEDLAVASEAASSAVAYRIGARMCFADFHEGNNDKLRTLTILARGARDKAESINNEG